MRMSLRAMLVAGLLLTAASWAFAADTIDNPQYTSWAKFKVGTSVTLKTESDMGGMNSQMETTMTLLELTPDKAVVETKMSMNAAGHQMDMPARKMDIPAKIEKPAPTLNGATPATEPAKVDAKQSTEEIDVAGKKIKCKVVEATTVTNGMTTKSKSWTSEEVPGGLVKMEATMEGPAKGTTKMAVTAMTIK